MNMSGCCAKGIMTVGLMEDMVTESCWKVFVEFLVLDTHLDVEWGRNNVC
jgi:hypothetical protein